MCYFGQPHTKRKWQGAQAPVRLLIRTASTQTNYQTQYALLKLHRFDN